MPAPASRTPTALVAALIVVLACELWFSIRHDSQTFDESAHIFSGMHYWEHGDFGVNPEHPPLVKLLAALPLLSLHPNLPPVPNQFFRFASGTGGLQFLYSSGNDAETLLFRARIAASLITLALALVVFLVARGMFGIGAGLIGLVILVFEPNILANGALVTTDIAAASGMLASIYTFYRYAKKRTTARLAICGLVTGLALASKHSNLLLFLLLTLLGVSEVLRRNPSAENGAQVPATREIVRWGGALVAIGVLAVAVLWSFYGFHYRARPGSAIIVPPLAAYLQDLPHPTEARVTLALYRSHLLPEAYVYGLGDIETVTQHGRPAFVLGKLYPTGRWFYFPLAFLIKSTLPFLLLLLLLPFARRLRAAEKRREVLFLTLPVVIYFAVSLTSHLDIGVRHILPIYPFLIVLAAGGAWSLMQKSRAWGFAVVVLLVLHAASSLHAYPHYLAYSNEAWGGPKNTYKVLSDSNVGWTSGLKAMHEYIVEHRITDCWFAYSGLAPYAYYSIPCRSLPTFFSAFTGTETGPIPASFDGTVFVDEPERTGAFLGPEDLNPYRPLVTRTPDEVIAGEILVFHGHFDVPALAALSHIHAAFHEEAANQLDQALAEIRLALSLNPNSADGHYEAGLILQQQRKPTEAHAEFEEAAALATAEYPEFQEDELSAIRRSEK